MLVSDTKDIVSEFCEAGAEAIRSYVDVSGLDPLEPPYMPEYFMPAFILQRLGRTRMVTLETSVAHLVVWNDRARNGKHLAEALTAETSQQTADLLSKRVDMVIFDGPASPDRRMLALVEFKPGWISFESQPARMSDRDKLLRILPLVETCPYGIACGWMRRDGWDWFLGHKSSDGETHSVPVPGSFKDGRQYLFGAVVLANPAFPGSYPVSPSEPAIRSGSC